MSGSTRELGDGKRFEENVQIAALRPRLVLGEARRFAVDFLLACLNDPRLARFPRGHAPAVGVSTLGRFAPAVIAGCVWVYHVSRIAPWLLPVTNPPLGAADLI